MDAQCNPPKPKLVQLKIFGGDVTDKDLFEAIKPKLIRCGVCGKFIEALTEEEALADMEGHGWTNMHTAHERVCYHCANRSHPSGFDYETYYAGRVRIVNGDIRVLVGNGIYHTREWGEVEYSKR